MDALRDDPQGRRSKAPAIALAAGILLFGMLASACSYNGRMLLRGATETPSASPTTTATPTLTPTPTSTPTPTPVPAARIDTGDRSRFYGDWEKALQEYQAAYDGSSDPDVKSAALLGVGRTHNQAGRYQEALEPLMALLEQYPESKHSLYAYFELGQAYHALGQYTQAAQAYLDYLVRRPGVVDAYVLNLRGDALASAGAHAEAVNDYRAALQAPSLLDSLNLELKIGRSHAASGDYETALGIYDTVYSQTSSDYTRAAVNLLKGQAYTALGQTEQAYAAYLDSVNNYPIAYDSYQALVALVDAGVPVDELNRGIVDYYAGETGYAMQAFERYLLNSPADPATAYYFNGLALRAIGNNAGAVAEWDKVIQNHTDHPRWDDAWEQKAYTQWGFMNQYPEAVQTLLGFVSAAPAHARAGEFLYDAAGVAERNGDLRQAAELWQRVGATYPGDERAPRALLLGGIALYRLEDYTGAYNTFLQALNSSVSLYDRSAAYLWQGKALQAQGDEEKARATWELAANTDPTGYYSERARDLLRGLDPFQPPEEFDMAVDLQRERVEAEAWLKSSFGLDPGTDLSSLGPLAEDPRLVRGAELWELGLYETARNELENLRQALEGDAAGSYRLTNYLIEIGSYRSAILAARQALTYAGMDDADTMSAPAYFNHVRFGTYFSDLIIPAAQEYGFHPLFLFSVVRQESAFEGFVRSSAGARGLMQIIPATGQELATENGWPPDYTDEDLYRPLVSVRFGSDYLAKWRDHFDGNLYAALAAYNGGPGNSQTWLKISGEDYDVFLEVVRFEETRTYIRSIYEIFSIYRRLYDRSP